MVALVVDVELREVLLMVMIVVLTIAIESVRDPRGPA